MTIHVHEWTRGVSESTRSRNGSFNGIGIEINILKSLKPMANEFILRLPAPFASAVSFGNTQRYYSVPMLYQ